MVVKVGTVFLLLLDHSLVILFLKYNIRETEEESLTRRAGKRLVLSQTNRGC